MSSLLVKELQRGSGSAVLRQRDIVVAILRKALLAQEKDDCRYVCISDNGLAGLAGLAYMRLQCRGGHHGPLVRCRILALGRCHQRERSARAPIAHVLSKAS
jgi:hypothetical protein